MSGDRWYHVTGTGKSAEEGFGNKREENEARIPKLKTKGEKMMNNKGVGAVFCLIASVLMAARYVSAAIFMSGVASWDSALFRAGLEYIGPALPTAAVAALAVGVVFLGIGITQDIKGLAKKK